MRGVVNQLLVLLFLFALSPLSLKSQDIHFSHIHASPTMLNPGMTGLFNGKMRFIGNARGQWNSVTNGYRSFGGSLDARLHQFSSKDIIAGGLHVVSDKAGDLDFTTTNVGASISVLKSLGEHSFSLGMQSGVISNRVDYSKIVAFDVEPAVLAGAPDKVTYLDVNVGLAWFYNFDRFSNIYGGAALYHLNSPDVSFYKDNDIDESLLLKRRMVIHGGAEIEVNRRSMIKPSFLIMNQKPHREITLGSFWKYKSVRNGGRKSVSSIYLGGWLRWSMAQDYLATDAIIAALRFDYKKTFVSLTYDVNISTLTRASSGAGGPEFSVIHIIDDWGSRRPTKVRCPDF
ncbi:MAG: type IX secretion system PorP/SprF family membrane protein [Gammaproteobacteria bacterium]|jgi:type IX secretion system PorP/SprF family membrane protein